MIQTCNQHSGFTSQIFGGWNLFGEYCDVQKNFINVPSHYQVEVDVNLYFVDSWDGESYRVAVDSDQIICKYGECSDWPNVNYCGYSWQDNVEQYASGNSTHSASTLTIYFFTYLNQLTSDESYGFKDFKVYLYNYCDNSCATCSANSSPTSCTSCLSFAELSGNTCVCRNKFYLSSTPYSYCAKCDVTCMTCTGGASTQCSSCYSGFTLTSGVCNPATGNFFFYF